MSDLTCVRVLHFDAGHRLVGHEGKCAKLHGHRYTCEAYCVAEGLDSVGRIVDFGVIKDKLGAWIDNNWDHNLILSKADVVLGEYVFKALGQRVYWLEVNPTAENMASYLLKKICPLVFGGFGVVCTKIRLWETPNCFVDASISD